MCDIPHIILIQNTIHMESDIRSCDLPIQFCFVGVGVGNMMFVGGLINVRLFLFYGDKLYVTSCTNFCILFVIMLTR